MTEVQCLFYDILQWILDRPIVCTSKDQQVYNIDSKLVSGLVNENIGIFLSAFLVLDRDDFPRCLLPSRSQSSTEVILRCLHIAQFSEHVPDGPQSLEICLEQTMSRNPKTNKGRKGRHTAMQLVSVDTSKYTSCRMVSQQHLNVSFITENVLISFFTSSAFILWSGSQGLQEHFTRIEKQICYYINQ